MRDFFKGLFEYSHHFNTLLAEQFLAHGHELPDESKKLFCHILNAHHIWNSRIKREDPTYGVWNIHPPMLLAAIDKENYNQSIRIIDQFEFEKTINYTNSKGEAYSNTVRDILFHVVNHSNYHRAQIATAFKTAGLKPLTTDYIFYKR